jgi:hypothetical protein
MVSGMVIIAKGFVWDDSVFTGHFGPMSIFFDGLGLFLIGFGAYKLLRDRQPQELTAPASKANSYR